MQFLRINQDDTLIDIIKRVGAKNIDSVLNLNGLGDYRVQNIGEVYYDTVIDHDTLQENVSNERKLAILNSLIGSTDVFETAALSDESGWHTLDKTGTLSGYLRIPDDVYIPDAEDVLGDNNQVSKETYVAVIHSVGATGTVSPTVFNEYLSERNVNLVPVDAGVMSPIQWFNLPWGKISLYSSITDSSVDFPVYPQGINDGVKANYEQMPDLIYQYEPWQVFTGSGPRSNTYIFDMHRDMWTGDHMDGKCNELIRFCEANCYAEYKGAAVNTALVTLYINGTPHIRGVLTDVGVEWDSDSPLGHDGFYLHVKLSLTITEVSDKALNFGVMLNKGLIG